MSEGLSPHLETLIDVAHNHCLAVMMYRKSSTRDTVRPRMIEAYGLTQGKQDMMVRAYQIEHEGDPSPTGWRFFMTHKIDDVRPTTIAFKPRRKVCMRDGPVEERYKKNLHWADEGRQAYRNIVWDALADGRVTPSERFDIDAIVDRHGLTQEDVRFVHASIYNQCLQAVVADGFMTEEEIDQIRFLHKILGELGWCVGD